MCAPKPYIHLGDCLRKAMRKLHGRAFSGKKEEKPHLFNTQKNRHTHSEVAKAGKGYECPKTT